MPTNIRCIDITSYMRAAGVNTAVSLGATVDVSVEIVSVDGPRIVGAAITNGCSDSVRPAHSLSPHFVPEYHIFLSSCRRPLFRTRMTTCCCSLSQAKPDKCFGASVGENLIQGPSNKPFAFFRTRTTACCTHIELRQALISYHD